MRTASMLDHEGAYLAFLNNYWQDRTPRHLQWGHVEDLTAENRECLTLIVTWLQDAARRYETTHESMQGLFILTKNFWSANQYRPRDWQCEHYTALSSTNQEFLRRSIEWLRSHVVMA